MTWVKGQLLRYGRYEIIAQLGSGGFGLTYLAKDFSLDNKIVIKRPNATFQADRDYAKFLRRFTREGQVLAETQTPNVVRIIDFCVIEEMPCLIMEFVEGETLYTYIRNRYFIPEKEACNLFQKLAVALDTLHQKEIIHCDIHPGNIIIQLNGEPILIDFGSTKLLNPSTWTVTTTFNDFFSSYEQIYEAASDSNSNPKTTWDIYSLSACMYFSVTGERPLSALARNSKDRLKSPRKIKPELTNRINKTILKGMACKARNRHSSIKLWARSLDPSQSLYHRVLSKVKYNFQKLNRTVPKVRKNFLSLFHQSRNIIFYCFSSIVLQ
jgi:serine/threonine protein kinase